MRRASRSRPAVRHLGRGDDQRVPPRQPVSVLDTPCPFDHGRVCGGRMPGEGASDIGSRRGGVHARLQLPGDRDIELLEHLKAGATARGAPQARPSQHDGGSHPEQGSRSARRAVVAWTDGSPRAPGCPGPRSQRRAELVDRGGLAGRTAERAEGHPGPPPSTPCQAFKQVGQVPSRLGKRAAFAQGVSKVPPPTPGRAHPVLARDLHNPSEL